MYIETIYKKASANESITFEEALYILKTPKEKLDDLFSLTTKLREKFQGKSVILCGIVNAKAGKCSEDCSFCAQSTHHQTKVDTYPLLSEKELVNSAIKAKNNGTGCFSIVTSGKGVVSDDDFKTIKKALSKIKDGGKLNRCVSLGIISKEQAVELKEAGLNKYHHNLETAESFFPEMCSTHTFQERIKAVKNAKEAGLEVCCGGIFNIGESLDQRVELALTIRELDVESIPINILNPIEGTKVYGLTNKIDPNDVLRLIAMFRFTNPTKTIGLFGGREASLGNKQDLAFAAGCNSILVGDYLTVEGQKPVDDIKMIEKLGLIPTYTH